jgi:hypothetical protein
MTANRRDVEPDAGQDRLRQRASRHDDPAVTVGAAARPIDVTALEQLLTTPRRIGRDPGRGFRAQRAGALLGMQQTVGNRAVQRLLQRATVPPTRAPSATAPPTGVTHVVQRDDAGAPPPAAAPDDRAVVVASLLSPQFGGPITFAAWHTEYGPSIALYSPQFFAAGSLFLDATKVADDEYELGFMQAVLASDMTAIYVDGAGTPVQTMHIGLGQVPVRDSEGGAGPWMRQRDVISINRENGATQTADTPRNLAPWQTPDKQGTLHASTGQDTFCTWLVLRHKAAGRLTALNWVCWNVDWGSAFEHATQKGTSTGGGGSVMGSGEGQGPFLPQTGSPVANDIVKITWGGPP